MRVLRDVVIRLNGQLIFVEARLEETRSKMGNLKMELNNSVIPQTWGLQARLVRQ